MVIKDLVKNLWGFSTRRKIVAFAVDDYGNVRLDSKKARDRLESAGVKPKNRFDAFDTLETTEDLEALFDVLRSAKDKNGHHAVFTPYSLPCNLDFESLKANHYAGYTYETLDQTFEKLANIHAKEYAGAWTLWKQGISEGIFIPQFHGREHLNIKIFESELHNNNPQLLINLQNRSLTTFKSINSPNLLWTAAFSFWDRDETKKFPEILKTGTEAFKKVFGYPSLTFTPPASHFPVWLESELPKYGIRYLDKSIIKKQHLGNGRFRFELNYLGKKIHPKLKVQTRNVVFEPTSGYGDSIESCIQQMSAAFSLNKPVIISSHRVNFCGLIEEKNRKKGLSDLKILLNKIISKWPDVEFMSISDLLNGLSND